jgi:serine phosphatase RsbU (regulator of sigma subunit)
VPAIELTLFEPNAAPRKLCLDADTITMGRTTASTVVISDRYLSRKHAEICFEDNGWVLRDHGSVNGTFLNGTRVKSVVPIRNGDRIQLGSAEVVVGESVEASPEGTEGSIALLSLDAMSVVKASAPRGGRETLVQRLAMELLEDRPMSALFDVIADRIMEVLRPSRVALALIRPDGRNGLDVVKLRTSESSDSQELTISRTLLHEVVDRGNVISFMDDAVDDPLAEAVSMMEQQIRSAVCAPLLGAGGVLGVLYIDYRQTSRPIAEDDVKLVAQIARIAAIKLESTQLRDAALEKERLEGSLRLARDIQMRMIPRDIPPLVPGAPFDIGADIRPARHVGGDFYDFHRDGSKLYFCIADVSGKGVPAALMMAVTRTLFRSMILTGATPQEIVSAVNRQLCSEADPSMFVTAFCAVLDLTNGQLAFVNAGHNPPFVIATDAGVRPLAVRPGLALGYLPSFAYVEQRESLRAGEMIYLYTDGITEATNAADQMFEEERLVDVLRARAADDAHSVAQATVAAVEAFAGGAPQSDDLTVLCIRYCGGNP